MTIKKLCLLSTAFVCISSPTTAQDFTIVNGQTVNTGRTLGDNNTGRILSNGLLDVMDDDAIQILGTNASFINDGNIITQSSGMIISDAINIQGTNANIINNGNIVIGDGDSAFSFGANGDGTNITNNGSILSLSAGGSILTLSPDQTSSNVTINNNGTIISEDATISFTGNGSNNVINNTGTIESNSFFAIGILSDQTTITNSGIIRSNVPNGTAIAAFSGDNTINLNQGSEIYGDIFTGDGNDILNLNAETLIQGAVDLGGGTDTVNINAN